jgi:broad specificity phosphatase PhoE
LAVVAYGHGLVNSPKYQAVKGWFVQGELYTTMPANYTFQYPNFGNQRSWSEVHHFLHQHPKSVKLLFMIRHGFATHNFVKTLMPYSQWKGGVNQQCWYQNYEIFDANLTDIGMTQAQALRQLLQSNDTFSQLMTGKSRTFQEYVQLQAMHHHHHCFQPFVMTSPIRRATQTALEVFKGMKVRTGHIIAMEQIRESMVDGSAANGRRSVSNPVNGVGKSGNCTFSEGYETIFNNTRVSYPMVVNGQGLGLWADQDELFTQLDNETPNRLELRAASFVQALFNNFPETQVMFAVGHGNIFGAIMQSLGLTNYDPDNCELIPILIQDMHPNALP